MERGVAPPTITLSDPLATLLLPVPMTLSSVGPKVSVPKGTALPPGVTTMIPLNWELRQPLGSQPLSPFGFLVLLNEQGKKGVTVLAGETDSDLQRENGLHLGLQLADYTSQDLSTSIIA